MILYIRAVARLIAFFTISLFGMILLAVGNFILLPLDGRWKVTWKNKIIKGWSRIISLILGIKITTKGNPPVPPFFLVSNHLSYIDPLLFWYNIDATFVAKSEIKSWPFFGWATQMLGVLFINRELRRDVHRINQRISATISEEQGVILFPEGTSTKGDEVKSFNPPLLKYPSDTQLPVHFCAISYQAPEPWQTHLDVCWWGAMPFFSHFWDLLKMPGFHATLVFGDETITATDRKYLAQKLHKAVSEKFNPVIEEQVI